MKKVLVVLCVLLMIVSVGCKKEEASNVEEMPQAVVNEATNAPAAPAEVKVETFKEPEEGTPLIQLENIDYDSEKEQIVLIISRQTFIPAPAEGVEDKDYQILDASGEGKTERLYLAKDATIEFPLPDASMGTVSVLPEEMTEEYETYVASNPGTRLLFSIMEDADGEVNSLVHFYTP